MEKKVLIVDDEQQIRKSFSEVFSREGWKVTAVASGEEALEVMRESPHMIVFLDLHLPGMDGIDLCERIRKDWPMAISHAVTGYYSLFELRECRLAGFDDFFPKPVEVSLLLEAASQAYLKVKRWREDV